MVIHEFVLATNPDSRTPKGHPMTEELKQGDEVWVRGTVCGQEPDDYEGERTYAVDFVDAMFWPKDGDIRKSLPEMNEAKERVVEAARVWRHTKPGTEDDEEAISVLSQAVNALEAAEKPSLEEEIKAILVEPYGDIEYTKILTGRILAIVEKHKGEQS